jgi:hypothetical protein
VVYANDAHQLSDVELWVLPPHVMARTHGGSVIDELRPEPSDLVIGKRFYSAFTDTHLESVLRGDNVGRLVLPEAVGFDGWAINDDPMTLQSTSGPSLRSALHTRPGRPLGTAPAQPNPTIN